MKAIRCEVCFSTDIIKQDGLFVCQACGIKYSAEQVEKLMVEIEGTVEVKGTVKVDNSDELANLYLLARRAKENNNSDDAEKYYSQIIVKDPSSWEATFYTTYYQAMNCKVAEIKSAAIKLSNCEYTVLQLIKENVLDEEERRKVIDEIGVRLINISKKFFDVAKNNYDNSHNSDGRQEMVEICCAASDILFKYGDYLVEFFENKYAKKSAVSCWKVAIEQRDSLYLYIKILLCTDEKKVESNKKLIRSYVDKVKKCDNNFSLFNEERYYQTLEQEQGTLNNKFDVCETFNFAFEKHELALNNSFLSDRYNDDNVKEFKYVDIKSLSMQKVKNKNNFTNLRLVIVGKESYCSTLTSSHTILVAISDEGRLNKIYSELKKRIEAENPSAIFINEEVQEGGCYVATCVYGSYDCPEVWTLRRYRDDTLGSTWYGRLFIKLYYAISPTIVKWFGETKWFKKMWKGKLDRMVKKLQEKGVEDTPYQDKNWK